MRRGLRVTLKVARAQVVAVVESLADDSVDSVDSEIILALLEANDVKLASGWAVRCALVHSRCKSVQGSVVRPPPGRPDCTICRPSGGAGRPSDGRRGHRARPGRRPGRPALQHPGAGQRSTRTKAEAHRSSATATHPGCHLFYLSTDRLQLLPVCSPAGYLEGTCCGHTPKCDA